MLGCLIVLAFVAVAVVGANMGLSLSAGSLRSAKPAALVASLPEDPPAEAAPAAASAPDVTPAEVLAARFPSEEAVPLPTFSAASVIPAGRGDAFDLAAVSGAATTEPQWPAADGVAPAAGAAAAPEPQLAEPEKEPVPGAAPRRSSARSPAVVNDAMIASIKHRLKLTSEQLKLWPPVEAALRKVVYTRAAMNPHRGQPGAAYIDPASPEVRELKSAAVPLLMRLSDEQKRQVRELVFVMGLEALASQF